MTLIIIERSLGAKYVADFGHGRGANTDGWGQLRRSYVLKMISGVRQDMAPIGKRQKC